jgi:hypothetical protein|tara:strand:+ start:5874 stop:6878 length:1005 start_codon:yes stop_codon:yes gene_type:complete
MFEYFYNEIFRSVIISFGSLFNGLEIQHKDSTDDTESVIKVPLAYGPTQKFLARIEQQADLNKPVQMTLPRMSFEFNGLQYDPGRKTTQTQTFVIKDPTTGQPQSKSYLPVPYNMSFELSIMTKLNDDALQIIEQILPYFQPVYHLPIKFLGNLNEKRDVAIQLDSVSMEDDYEGNFDTRRALVYTLRFTAKAYLFGPQSNVTNEIIRKTQVGLIAGNRGTGTYSRDLTYTVVPKATKDYDGSEITQLAENIDLTETKITVEDGTKVTNNTNIYIGDENMFVTKISGNDLSVKRAQMNTTPQEHVLGAAVFSITEADNAFIEIGDDFGFDGTVS